MKLNAYTIYDSAIAAYNTPFFLQTDGMAVRVFQDQVNNPESQISKNPQDFTLYKIGEYDDQTGIFEPGHITTLGNAKTYKEKIESEINREVVEEIRKIIREEMKK